MFVFKDKATMNSQLIEILSNGKSIGFIPTMGALHEGHLSLVKASMKQNDYTVVSIFVNPTQFNNPDDLKKYPRTEEKDIVLLTDVGCDFVYLPEVSDLYVKNESVKNYNFDKLDKVMEGAFRPGHFDGVATVVYKLIMAVNPTRTYFGEKDFQQLKIVQKMVKQEGLNTEIVAMPIFREDNGLAMSSRNIRLTDKSLKEAPVIYNILKKSVAQKKLKKSPAEIKQFVKDEFNKTSFILEYFEIADEENLQSINSFKKSTKARGFVAVYADKIRLIDNISFEN